LPVLEELDDGSFLSEIRPTGVARELAQAQAIKVRVIERKLAQARGQVSHFPGIWKT
jgi:hypothetical protein